MNIIEGQLIAQDLKIAIVVARFNEFIGSKLVGGALDGLKRHGVSEDAIDLAWVPGAYEIPLVAQKMAASGTYGAVITLGRCHQGCNGTFRLRLFRSVQRRSDSFHEYRRSGHLRCPNDRHDRTSHRARRYESGQ